MALKWYDGGRTWGEHESMADAGPIRLAVWPVCGGYAATMETRVGLHTILPAQSQMTYSTRAEAKIAACMLLQQLRDQINAALDADGGEG